MARRLTGRPGIVGQLMLVSVVLLVIPLLAFRYLHEMHDFVLDGQRNALQLAAQAVATVLHGREDLFADAEGLPFSPWEDESCSPLPFEAPIRLDGSGRDWSTDPQHTCRYQRAQSSWRDAGGDTAFDLRLGQRDRHLYALFEVADDVVHFRHPQHRNLDGSDHLRITIPNGALGDRRYVVTAKEPGALTSYEVGESWRYALGDGRPVASIRGALREFPGGYTLELRIPIAMLPGRKIGFAIADVDSAAAPAPSLVGVAARGASGRIHLVLLESPEILRILEGLELSGARITVFDERHRIRSEVGSVPDAAGDPRRGALVNAALERAVGTSQSGAATTAAVSPIRSGGRVVGAVLVEQANDRILALPRQALERERNAIVLACAAIAAIFWAFAWRLAWRIHRLGGEVGDAIGPDGRARNVAIHSGGRARDEIGDLSRTFTDLLARLARYTSFLEQIPSTLRHELSNPLNTLCTSLENLAAEHPVVADSRYLHRAERGVTRINEIIAGLTEAASLEEALGHDEIEIVDLATLVLGYVDNFAASCPSRRFSARAPCDGVPILASGFRVEQLLDKLVDNAVAFSPKESEIILSVARAEGRAELRIANEGPLLSDEARERAFESMFSTRKTGVNGKPHLGIGLYVVRLIAERFGGKVEVADRPEGNGPEFTVALPLANASWPSSRPLRAR
jgi:two-component system sensor histidine kinase ChvG